MSYAELHCRSNFSFLAGGSHPHELVERAAGLGLGALAITDLSGLYGVVRAWEAAQRVAGAPRLIYGSELELDSEGVGRPDDALVLLARSAAGYAQISHLITGGRRRAEKGAFSLGSVEVRAVGGAELVVLCGGPRSRLLRLVRAGETEAARAELGALREAFGDELYLELTRHKRPGDRERSLALLALGRALGVPAMATNDVHFHQRHRKKLHDVLTCIRLGCSLREAGRRLLPNAERELKSGAQMTALFADIPEVVARTAEVAARCTFSLEQLRYRYPPESVPPDEQADAYLARLARQGLVDRLGPRRAAEQRPQLEKELSIIAQLGYAGYFLTMYEVVRFCQRKGILCQGRGSAANSLVCYATGVTAVSPDQIDMLFERFVSLERHEPPDIDLDIEHDRREEVIQHVYEKYGRDHAAMVAEVIRYRHRSAVRDTGKVLGLSDQALLRITRYLAAGWNGVEEQVTVQRSQARRLPKEDGLASAGANKRPRGARSACRHMVPHGPEDSRRFAQVAPGCLGPAGPGGWGPGKTALFPGRGDGTSPREQVEEQAAVAAGIDPACRTWKQLVLISSLLLDFPRHLSIHVGGFVLSREPVADIVPIENGRMADRTVIQWDKDDIDALGIFKVDLLGLGMLNVIARAFRIIAAERGIELDLAGVPPDDPQTYEMIRHADTIGVFQIESRAQMNMLPRLQPRDFYDLVVEVALVRPGPIQGGMVHPYLERRRGEEPIVYPHPKLHDILHRTMGVPIFQEQVMRIAVAVGGYTPGEADQLRRDMAAWRRSGNMERHQQRLSAAMRAQGISEEFIERIIRQIEGFGSYGFPESHAASFAHLVYISAYLKCHFPAEFAAALINAQPMGFYLVCSIVADAYRHGVPIFGVDVQHSGWETAIVQNPRESAEHQPTALRLGLRLVRDFSQEAGERVVSERARHGPFTSIAQLARRCQLSRKQLGALALAGAFGTLPSAGRSLPRREAVWQAAALGGSDLTANLETSDAIHFSPLAEANEIELNYVYAQSFVERHPMELHREMLTRRRVTRATDLKRCRSGALVDVAGVVIVRQRPGGGKMIFMALEDETGLVDIAVHLSLFERYRPLIMLSSILIVRGELQLDGEARSVLAKHFTNLSSSASVRARNFH